MNAITANPTTRPTSQPVVTRDQWLAARKRLLAREKELSRLGDQIAFMRCGMYGGTPDKGIHQGTYVGDDVVEGDRYDVTRPEVRTFLAGLDEHQCRVTCDGETVVGVFQPIEPTAFHACEAGAPGWRFL